MRAKKFLALLLSGMVLAGCLSGCNRTIIEHQFHTDTVTDVEYIIENTGTNLDGVQNLLRYFIPHGIRAETSFEFFEVDGDEEYMETVYGHINKKPTSEIVQRFLSTAYASLWYVTTCDEEPTSWLTACSNAANVLYNELIQAGDESWKDKIRDKDPEVCFRATLYKCKSDNEYILATYIYNDFLQ